MPDRYWLPIETAPKDGSRLHLLVGGKVYKGAWWSATYDSGTNTWSGYWSTLPKGARPSHWKPLTSTV